MSKTNPDFMNVMNTSNITSNYYMQKYYINLQFAWMNLVKTTVLILLNDPTIAFTAFCSSYIYM